MVSSKFGFQVDQVLLAGAFARPMFLGRQGGAYLCLLYRVILTIGKRQGFSLWMNLLVLLLGCSCVPDHGRCLSPSCRSRSARPSRTGNRFLGEIQNGFSLILVLLAPPRTPRSSTSGTCTCISPSDVLSALCSHGCNTAGRTRRCLSTSARERRVSKMGVM